jgi:hypothetical protein
MEENKNIMVVAGNYSVQESTLQSNAAWADYCLNNYYRMQLEKGFLPSNRSIGYRKKIWELIGGFPEDLTFAGDDAVFDLQLYKENCSIGFAPKAMCFWERHADLKSFWREQYVYGFALGEANIFPLKFTPLWDKKYYFILYCFDALYMTIRRSPKAIFRTLLRRKFIASFVMPILIFGNIVSYYKGYKTGFISGNTKCIDCRSRLQ